MAVNASLVQYTGGSLVHIGVTPNQDLATILGEINTAVNSLNPAPDYSGYNLYCVKETDGTTHPTNTQNFAEGISKNLCDFHTAYDTFTGTTYPAAIATLTSGVAGLQIPGITYAPFSIVNTDTMTQVLNKNFTGIGTILTAINPNAANWSTLSLSTQTTITGGFNALISYLSSLTTTVNGKQVTIATIDNTANCLAGGATDSIRTTVLALTTYACALPTYAAGSISTWGAITTGTTLQNSVQHIVDAVNYLYVNGVIGTGIGLTLGSVGSTYQGKKLSIDTTYTQLYKVMVDSSDTTPNFLRSKLNAGTGITLSIENASGNEDILITNSKPADGKVLVNSSDTTSGYLVDKLVSTADTAWGLALNPTTSQNNSIFQLVPTIGQPSLFTQSLFNLISTDPSILAQFATLIAQATATPLTTITNLATALSGADIVLTWTHQSGISQNAKWRVRGNSAWITTGFTVANPMTSTAITNTLSSATHNTPLQFQVDTVYSNGLANSNINEEILFFSVAPSYNITGGVIEVDLSPFPVGLDIVQWQLWNNSGPTLIQSATATGASPSHIFSSVGSGTYVVKWRYGATINGVVLYSDDPSQIGSWVSSSPITI